MKRGKKWLIAGVCLLLVCLMINLLTGCGKNKQTENSGQPSMNSQQQNVQTGTKDNEKKEIPANEQKKIEQDEKAEGKKNSGQSVSSSSAGKLSPAKGPVVLTIKGSGVKHTREFSLEELKQMKAGYIEEIYSAVNNWPSKKYFAGKGVKLSHLLNQAGIQSNATTLVIRGSDGYFATFTKSQLLEGRYYYPNLIKNSTAGSRHVPAIIAWEHREGRDLSKAKPGNLQLMVGQKSISDVTTAGFVQNITTIEVRTSPAERWVTAAAQPAAGTVKAGTDIVLNHPDMDRVKIYYTTDGSTPTQHSALYNLSTSYFQPQLNKPISVNGSVVIKAIASGFGKNDSEVAVFRYDVN